MHVDEIQPRRLCANIDYIGPSGFELKKNSNVQYVAITVPVSPLNKVVPV